MDKSSLRWNHSKFQIHSVPDARNTRETTSSSSSSCQLEPIGDLGQTREKNRHWPDAQVQFALDLLDISDSKRLRRQKHRENDQQPPQELLIGANRRSV